MKLGITGKIFWTYGIQIRGTDYTSAATGEVFQIDLRVSCIKYEITGKIFWPYGMKIKGTDYKSAAAEQLV